MAYTPVTRIRSAQDSALELVQREFPQYHPLVALTRLAHRTEVMMDPKLELEVHKAILPYVSAKLSSVEVKHELSDDDRRVVVSLFEQQTLPDGRTVAIETPLISEVSDLVPFD